MIYSELNASEFEYKNDFFNSEFEFILSKIIECYYQMINDNTKLRNNENDIRDVLYLKYLNDNSIRMKLGLRDYKFDREIQEDRNNGRTDIRIITVNTFIDTSAYYIIECKRIDSTNCSGTSGLNAMYIQNGMKRFISDTYSTYYKTNGMIGFVVEPIDINNNIGNINKLITESFSNINTTKLLYTYSIVDGFNYSYYSIHRKNDDKILIYHLMFDFSANIY